MYFRPVYDFLLLDFHLRKRSVELLCYPFHLINLYESIGSYLEDRFIIWKEFSWCEFEKNFKRYNTGIAFRLINLFSNKGIKSFHVGRGLVAVSGGALSSICSMEEELDVDDILFYDVENLSPKFLIRKRPLKYSFHKDINFIKGINSNILYKAHDDDSAKIHINIRKMNLLVMILNDIILSFLKNRQKNWGFVRVSKDIKNKLRKVNISNLPEDILRILLQRLNNIGAVCLVRDIKLIDSILYLKFWRGVVWNLVYLPEHKSVEEINECFDLYYDFNSKVWGISEISHKKFSKTQKIS